MDGASENRRQADRLARVHRVAGYAGPIGAGLLSREEWARQARELADRERLLRDAGLTGSNPVTSVRKLLGALIRRASSIWQPARRPQSTIDPG